MSYNLIIPMAGQGKRFVRAGYQDYKPFIKINGKFMIEYVIEQFPKMVNIHIITSSNLLTELQEKDLINLGCNIIYIDPHNKGPAYSIYQAQAELDLTQRFFISYVDIFWHWDWDDVEKHLDHAGVIFTHRGFHPHLVDNNYSAFCLPDESNQSIFLAIKEKESFTDNWMEEHLSIGLFYVKSGKFMIDAISSMINNKDVVNGEYFPSLIFNYLKTNENSIKLIDVNSFIHWGIPEQLNDYLAWRNILLQNNTHDVHMNKYHSIMTMAGLGLRMQNISQQPKALIPIQGKPMFEFVFDRFNANKKSLITTAVISNSICSCDKFSRYVLEQQTSSQFDTILSAKEFIKTNKEFFLLSCDSYGVFDINEFSAFIQEYNPDAVIFSFYPSLLQQKKSVHHTHISYSDHRVTGVHIKSKSSDDDLGLAGFFWVKNGNDIISVNEVVPFDDVELTADHIFKQMIADGFNVLKYNLNHYVHLGTPTEFNEYQYWSSRKDFFI